MGFIKSTEQLSSKSPLGIWGIDIYKYRKLPSSFSFKKQKWDKGIGNLEKFGKIAELRNLKTNVCEKKKALLIEIAHGDSGFWEATFWLLPQGYCCSHPLGAWYGVWISIRSPRPGERKYKRAVQTLGLGCQGKALQHVIWLCKCSWISVSPEAPKLVSN